VSTVDQIHNPDAVAAAEKQQRKLVDRGDYFWHPVPGYAFTEDI